MVIKIPEDKSPKVGNKFINLYETGKILYSLLNCVIKKFLNAENFGTLKKIFWHNLIVDNQNIAFWKNISGYILEEEEQMIMYQRSRIYFITRRIFSSTSGNLFPTFGDLFPTFGDLSSTFGNFIRSLWGFIIHTYFARGCNCQIIIWHGDM